MISLLTAEAGLAVARISAASQARLFRSRINRVLFLRLLCWRDYTNGRKSPPCGALLAKGGRRDQRRRPDDQQRRYGWYTKCARRFCCQHDSVLSVQNGFSLP